MKKKLILLLVLSFVFVYAGSILDHVNDSNIFYAAQTTPEVEESDSPEPTSSPTAKPTASPTPTPPKTARPIRTTAKPTASPTPTQKPTPTPTRKPTAKPTVSPTPTASPTPTVSPTPIPTPPESETPDPDASPTPEKPTLPNIAIPDLDFPATDPPENTPDPNAYDDPEPTPTPSPSPSPSPTPEPGDLPTWSGLIKFIARIFYIAAIITALYALFFYLICVLFKKQPDMGFWIFKRKKTKKKGSKQIKNIEKAASNTKMEPEMNTATGISGNADVPDKFDHEAAAYFAGKETTEPELHKIEAEVKDMSENPSSEVADEIEPVIESIKSNIDSNTLETSPLSVASKDEKETVEALTDITELETEDAQVMPEETVEPEEIKFTTPHQNKPISFKRAVDREKEAEDKFFES